ncbi:hypothetical protein [Ichthyenterobacterium magnum]|uniref:Uncharacterized protein n=1 Tax=Ichthyenterobacterium magnum TaxID=1230530 RepID=A0A420DUF3_9FLAO|nr:hypothetical protein [Ichthyenterobacterium magnum]RKE97954.1 hypothetical protein BXY80_0019 [Ichthyenterobacterium magnum]
MKFITKILAGFGNIRAMEKLHVDDHTEAIINDIDNAPFAISDNNVLFAGLNELGGYYFFQTVVVGTFHIKTIKGAQLTLTGIDFEIVLESDMEELESDHSNVSNRSISKIDFQIEKEDIDKVDATRIKKMVLTSKKKVVEFTIYKKGTTD